MSMKPHKIRCANSYQRHAPAITWWNHSQKHKKLSPKKHVLTAGINDLKKIQNVKSSLQTIGHVLHFAMDNHHIYTVIHTIIYIVYIYSMYIYRYHMISPCLIGKSLLCHSFLWSFFSRTSHPRLGPGPQPRLELPSPSLRDLPVAGWWLTIGSIGSSIG